jgi:hypothetical protein
MVVFVIVPGAVVVIVGVIRTVAVGGHRPCGRPLTDGGTES